MERGEGIRRWEILGDQYGAKRSAEKSTETSEQPQDIIAPHFSLMAHNSLILL